MHMSDQILWLTHRHIKKRKGIKQPGYSDDINRPNAPQLGHADSCFRPFTEPAWIGKSCFTAVTTSTTIPVAMCRIFASLVQLWTSAAAKLYFCDLKCTALQLVAVPRPNHAIRHSIEVLRVYDPMQDATFWVVSVANVLFLFCLLGVRIYLKRTLPSKKQVYN